MLITPVLITADARKIKNTFRIEKNSERNSTAGKVKIEGRELNSDNLPEDLKKCSFSGYDKEATSSRESFIVSNPSEKILTGFKVKINYLDMQGRMLHSRIVEESCIVPPGESRRIDIKSWDTQHVFYYHLGNEPRRVATPFQVEFKPVSFFIE